MPRSTIAGANTFVHAGAFDASTIRDLFDNLGAGSAVILTGTTDAIPFPGTVFLNTPGIDLCTLPLPNAGPQFVYSQTTGLYGDDGKTVEIISMSGFAHVITTPANGVNGNKHIITWAAAPGNNVTLQANGGTWWTVGTPNGVTIT